MDSTNQQSDELLRIESDNRELRERVHKLEVALEDKSTHASEQVANNGAYCVLVV